MIVADAYRTGSRASVRQWWVSGPVLHLSLGDVVISIENHKSSRRKKLDRMSRRFDAPGVDNVQEFCVSGYVKLPVSNH